MDEGQTPKTMEKIPHFNIFDEIVSWSEGLTSWENYAIKKIMLNQINEEKIDDVYEEFLKENQLTDNKEASTSHTLKNSAIPQPSQSAEKFQLTKIKHIKNVNALKENQEINFGKELTVIYGTNASGKSGYARILKEGCFTRSKNTKILDNVLKANKDSTGQETWFTFEPVKNANETEIQENKENEPKRQENKEVAIPILRDNFSFFDNTCVRVYTDNQNNFHLDPYGFDVFPKLAKVTLKIKEQLEKEIDQKINKLPPLTPPENESEFSEMLTSLNPQNSVENLPTQKLKEIVNSDANFEEQINRINEEISELHKEDPIKAVEELNQLIKDITELHIKLKKLWTSCADVKIKLVKSLKKNISDLEKKGKLASIDNFKNEPIPKMDAENWIDLISTAIKFNTEIYKGNTFPAEINEPLCVLCQQLLSPDAQDRLKRFWEFIKSETQNEIIATKKRLEEELKLIEETPSKFYNTDSAIKRNLQRRDNKLESKIETFYFETKARKKGILNSGDQEVSPAVKQPEIKTIDCLDDLKAALLKEIASLEKKNISQKIADKKKELIRLKHQNFIRQQSKQIFSVIDSLKWADRAKNCKKQLSTNHITTKQKELTKKLIGLNFTENFEKEIKELDINLPIEIKISGEKGRTSKKLTIGDSTSSAQTSEVLSEGEQNVIAIADFLTEVALAKNISGVIFDDPATSLDHHRKEKIAKRLAKEAKARQVIIFTHDIVFTHHLAKAAVENEINFTGKTISRGHDDLPGHVEKEVFPHTQYEGKILKDIEALLQEAKTLEGIEQKEKLELGFSKLRTAYEDFIQKDLFCKIVNRWQEEIKISYLKDLYFDEETINSVDERYSFLCRYIPGHSHSPEYQETPISCELLSGEIIKFEAIKTNFKKLKKKFAEKKEESNKNFS